MEMSKETYYFQHDYEPTADPKIQALIKKYDWTGYGLFWRICEMLHSDETHKLPLKKYLYISLSNNSTSVEQVLSFVKDCISDFELFESDNDFFWSKRVFKNIDRRNDISEKRSFAGKESARKRAEQKQQNSTSVQQNPTKEIKEKEIKENNTLLSAQSFQNFTPPTYLQVEEQFFRLHRGKYQDERIKKRAKDFHDYYTGLDWKKGITRIVNFIPFVQNWSMEDKKNGFEKKEETHQPLKVYK